MANLKEHQTAFYHAHFGTINRQARTLITQAGLSNDERLSIYRNNSFITLSKALTKTFPVVAKLVGDDFFNYCATEYIKDTPPAQGPLFEYGDNFPDFLEHFEPAKSILYLGDVARLEWLINIAYHAKNLIPIVADMLANIPDALFTQMQLVPHPSCQLITSDYPIGEIWLFNQEANDQIEVDFNQSAQIIVCRQNMRVNLHPTDHSTITFIELLSGGKTIGQSLQVVQQSEPDFDPVITLIELISRDVFCQFHLPCAENSFFNSDN